MAKRFTDTEKWKKDFIRELPVNYKLLWFYILDECDHAGVWHCEIDVASLRIGEKIDKKEAMKRFKGKIIPFDGGKKWFLPDFITFQYGELNPSNRAHKSVIEKLKKYELLDENNKIVIPPTEAPYEAPYEGAMDKEKEKDMDMDKDMDKEKDPRAKKNNLSVVKIRGGIGVNESGTRVNGVPIPGPLQDVEKIAEAYAYYCEYLKETKGIWPGLTTTQMDLQTLVELQQQGNDPISVIKQTIHSKNKSFYPLRKDFSEDSKDRRESFSEFLEGKGVV